jgi:hypothetical protein
MKRYVPHCTVQEARADEARRLYFEVPDNVRDFFGSTAIELVRSVRSKVSVKRSLSHFISHFHTLCHTFTLRVDGDRARAQLQV